MWYRHVGIFSLVEQVDGVIIWMNLLCLMFISFLPYGTGLVSSYQYSGEDSSLAITICSLDILLIGICMLLILLYAFRRQSLLHPTDADIVSIRRASMISVVITPAMSLLALCFSFLTAVPYISQFLFYSIGITSYLSRLCVYYYFKKRKLADNLHSYIIQSVGGTTRTEAFSDGIFSIVATLIVLDLTTGIPEVENTKLITFLRQQRFVIVSYVTSFLIVGLLWYLHYGMMHFIVKMTPVLSFLNSLILFCVGGTPFVSGVDSIFSEALEPEDNGPYSNKSISIRTFSAFLFLATIGQLLFWSAALWNKAKCMSRDVETRSSENLQFCKLIMFPVVSFIIFWCTYSETFMSYGLYSYMLFFTPIIFLIMKIAFQKRNSVVKLIVKLRYRLHSNEEVNHSDHERTALIGNESASSGSGNTEISTINI